MGKGSINITKKGDFHFSFKVPFFFLNNKTGTKMEKRANLECGMQEFVSASWLRWFFYNKVIHFFCSYLAFSASGRVNWKLDFITYKTWNLT